jgi:hypothetical protein
VKTDLTKRIVCSIDFSESSKDALKWAVSLAIQHKTHLTILFTYRLLNSRNGEVLELRKKTEENAIRNFSVLEDEIVRGRGVSYDFKIEVGFVSSRVADYVKKAGVSFLVMGKQMNSTNRESFDELAESIQVPLVIVP